MTEVAEKLAVRIASLLVFVGFASSFVLWTLDTAYASGELLFALYLSMDLISFAMIAYVYRTAKAGDAISRIWMVIGFCVLLALITVGFVYANPPY